MLCEYVFSPEATTIFSPDFINAESKLQTYQGEQKGGRTHVILF